MAKLLVIVRQNGSCVTNPYAVEEARKNLDLKKFGTLEGLDSLLTEVRISNQLVRDLPVDLNSKDVPILGGAIAQRCSHLLTGDQKDFGFLFGQLVEGVLVVSPQLLAEELVAKQLLKKKSR